MFNWLRLLSGLALRLNKSIRLVALAMGCTSIGLALFSSAAHSKIVEVRFAGTAFEVVTTPGYTGDPNVGPAALGPFHGQFSYDDTITPYSVEITPYYAFATYLDIGGSVSITFSDGKQFTNANDRSYRIVLSHHNIDPAEELVVSFYAAELGEFSVSRKLTLHFVTEAGTFEFSSNATIPPLSSYYPSSYTERNGGSLTDLVTEPCDEGPYCAIVVKYNITTVYEPNYVSCEGFAAPFESAVNISARANRAIPVPLELFNSNGFELRDTDITAPPVIDVDFIGMAVNDASTALNDELLEPIGNSNEGNAFAFNTETDRWEHRLGTKQYTEPGTYRVTARSGNDVEYVIDANGQCVQTFTRQP